MGYICRGCGHKSSSGAVELVPKQNRLCMGTLPSGAASTFGVTYVMYLEDLVYEDYAFMVGTMM